MTTADQLGLRGWRSSAEADAAVGSFVGDEDYTGKHRRPGMRGLSLRAMFYMGRHRTR